MTRIGIAAVAASASLALTSQPAHAQLWCTGTISSSWIDSVGNAYIAGNWRDDHTQICSVRQEWKGISPDICLSWLAKVDSSIGLSKSIIVSYSAYPAGITCSTLGTYGDSPAPLYVMLLSASAS